MVTWLHFVFALIMPLLILTYCAYALWKRLFLKSRFNSASAERQVVLRLALTTTLSHLLLEVEGSRVGQGRTWGLRREEAVLQIPVGVVASLWVSLDVQGASDLVDFANFASLTNAALPFFLFLLCSRRFRLLAAGVFAPCVAEPLPPPNPRSSLIPGSNPRMLLTPRPQRNGSAPAHLALPDGSRRPSAADSTLNTALL